MLWYENFDREVAEHLPEASVIADEPLSRHCSFRIGGPARRMAFPVTSGQLVMLDRIGRACLAEPLVLGNGTNILFPDEGLDRLVVSTRELCRMERTGETEIRAEAGLSLARLAVFAQQNELTGLEFAHGIPGSVGGAVCMNAGAYGGEMKDVLVGAQIWFPEEGVRFLTVEEMDLGYRHSILTEHPDAVVLYAVLHLEKGDGAAIRQRMDELMARRKASQPLEFPSAGSTFKRPVGYFAGALIEQAGLKGASVGGAQVSPKHAGFVINTGDATCADVKALIAHIRKTVLEKDGVLLEPEVRIID
ncbi:MAG: UDP-N-acetylmuramate dehydrogenase [Oscillospiraceae bacterium]|nr:UDP-N-acetylmuramate dehydrogenase [Oscillospiraceae bacterium]